MKHVDHQMPDLVAMGIRIFLITRTLNKLADEPGELTKRGTRSAS